MLLKNGSTGNYVIYLQYGLHIMCCLRVVLTANLALVLKMLLRSIRAKKVLPKMALLAMVHGMHW